MSVIAPDFCGHWKTRMLAELLGEKNALAYLVRLWCHCHARMEDEFKISTKELAALCEFPVLEADRLEKALIECRWVTRKKGQLTIVGWKDHNKGLFANRENGKKGGRPAKPPKGRNPSDTHGLPTGNPSDTHGIPAGNPLDTHGIPTGNPSAPHGQPKQNREERRGEDITPVVPLQGTSQGYGKLVSDVIDRLNPIFGRQKKWLGAGAMHFLQSIAMNGMLPLSEDDWRALETFYAHRDEYPAEPMWRKNVEGVAKELIGEVEKARRWLLEKGIEYSAPKKAAGPEKPEPPGWREWLAATYPTAELPAKFADLPGSVQGEFYAAQNNNQKGAQAA